MRYHVGAIHDGEQPGMAHLVEHLMFEQQLDGQPWLRPQQVEVGAPIDDDMFVIAWPLPANPELLAKVRAIAARS